MRRLTYTNSEGTSIVLGQGASAYNITKVEGIDPPKVDYQTQKSPFQDGDTFIDALYQPREIVVTGLIDVAKDMTTINSHRRILTHAFNTKLGEGWLLYEGDGVSRKIAVTADLSFATRDPSRDSYQRFQVAFRAADPMWQSTTSRQVSTALAEISREKYVPDSAGNDGCTAMLTPLIVRHSTGLVAFYKDETISYIRIKFSYDNGKTWSLLPLIGGDTSWSSTGAYSGTAFDAVVLPSGRIVVIYLKASAPYVRYSDDGGYTWSAVGASIGSGTECTTGCLLSLGGLVVRAWYTRWASPNTNLYTKLSTDGGVTWGAESAVIDTTLSTDSPRMYAGGTAYRGGTNLTILVFHNGHTGPRYYRSTDNGATYVSTIESEEATGLIFFWGGLLYSILCPTYATTSPTNSGFSHALSIKSSADGGATWGSPAPFWTGNTFPRRGKMVVTFQGKLLFCFQRSLSIFPSRIDSVTPLRPYLAEFVECDDLTFPSLETVLLPESIGPARRVTDTTTVVIGHPCPCSIKLSSGEWLLFLNTRESYSHKRMISSDEGQTWQTSTVSLAGNAMFRDIVQAADGNLVAVAAYTSTFSIFRSTDAGATWTLMYTITQQLYGGVPYQIGTACIIELPDETLRVLIDGKVPSIEGLYYTESGDNGVTWSLPISASGMGIPPRRANSASALFKGACRVSFLDTAGILCLASSVDGDRWDIAKTAVVLRNIERALSNEEDGDGYNLGIATSPDTIELLYTSKGAAYSIRSFDGLTWETPKSLGFSVGVLRGIHSTTRGMRYIVSPGRILLSSGGSVLSVPNDGDVECPVTLQVDGGVTDISFSVPDGNSQKIQYALPADGGMTVESEDGRKSVIIRPRTSPINGMRYLTAGSRFIKIPPGGAILTIESTECEAGTSVTATVIERFVGI